MLNGGVLRPEPDLQLGFCGSSDEWTIHIHTGTKQCESHQEKKKLKLLQEQ